MARNAETRGLTLSSSGKLGQVLLYALVAKMGRLKATGVLQVSQQRLQRRFIFRDGNIDVVASNARDDRLLEWALGMELLRLDEAQAEGLVERLGENPLAAGALLAEGVVAETELAELVEAQVLALLREMASWRTGEFQIVPGRLDLGGEPLASLPATDLVLRLAREDLPAGAPQAIAPITVISAATAEEFERLDLSGDERAVLAACARPMRRDELVAALPDLDSESLKNAVNMLWRSGLVDTPAPVEATQTRYDAALEPTRDEIEMFLAAANAEDIEKLLGVRAGEGESAVRRAYYMTVRRFHPDRFRAGRYAEYHARIEQAFRLVHESASLLSDAEKVRARKTRSAAGRQVRDETQVAAGYLAAAKETARRGQRSDAVTLLERGIKAFPGDPELRLALGLLLAGNPRRRGDAADLLSVLSDEHPGRADLMSAAALALRIAGRAAEGQRYENAAAALDPFEETLRALRGDRVSLDACAENPFLAPLLADQSARS